MQEGCQGGQLMIYSSDGYTTSSLKYDSLIRPETVILNVRFESLGFGRVNHFLKKCFVTPKVIPRGLRYIKMYNRYCIQKVLLSGYVFIRRFYI